MSPMLLRILAAQRLAQLRAETVRRQLSDRPRSALNVALRTRR